MNSPPPPPFISAAQIIEESGIKFLRIPQGTRLFGERQRASTFFPSGEGEPWKKRPRLSALEKQAQVNRSVLLINTAVRRGLDGFSRARLQAFMRTSPAAAEEMFHALSASLEHSTDARVSLHLFVVADYLFMRSGAFRSLAVEHMADLFFARCCDVEYAPDARSAVPSPLFAAGRLVTYSRAAVERWATHFGARYPQLRIASNLMRQFLSRKVIKSNYNREKTKIKLLKILESAEGYSGEYYQLREAVNSTVETIDGCFNILVPNLEIEGSFLYNNNSGGDNESAPDKEEIFPWDIGDDEDANRLYGIQGEDDDDCGESGDDDDDKEEGHTCETSLDVPFLFFDESGSNKDANYKHISGDPEADALEMFSFSDLFSDDDDKDEGYKDKDENGTKYVVPGFVRGCAEIVIELDDNGAASRISETNKACVVDKLDECERTMDKRLIPRVKLWIKGIDSVKVERLYDEPILVRRLSECRSVAVELLEKMNKRKSQRKQLNC